MAVHAVLFDLDGTLVDTESSTDVAVENVMAALGVAGVTLPNAETRGRTWLDTAVATLRHHPLPIAPAELADRFVAEWRRLLEGRTHPIAGAPEALAAAALCLPLGVVSSSPRVVIDESLARANLARYVPLAHRVGGDDVARGKPDPSPYLLGAARVGVPAAECLAFEDSVAGVQSARAAGMAVILVRAVSSERALAEPLASGAVDDYRGLSAEVWAKLRSGALGPEDLE